MTIQKSDIENFLNDQTNLDVMTYFAKGERVEEIAERIEKESSFVESKIEFLRDCGLVSFGDWNVDVNALGMIKTFEFCGFDEDGLNKLFRRNFYLSYFCQVEIGKTKYLAMYTFPEEVKDKIGSEISSWYSTFPHFRIPFFRNDFNKEKFLELYEEEDNDNELPSRGEKIKNPTLIDFFICRYVQLETSTVDLKDYAERMKKEIGSITEISNDSVEEHFRNLKKKNVIYPISPLNFTKISYTSVYCITSSEKIFKMMKTLNKFNIITNISLMKGREAFLIIHFPHKFKDTIINIFDQLRRENEFYFITKVHENRGFPYKHYLDKHKKPEGGRIG